MDWETRFDEETEAFRRSPCEHCFTGEDPHRCGSCCKCGISIFEYQNRNRYLDRIKSFIRTEIEQARQEGWEGGFKYRSKDIPDYQETARQQERARVEKIIEEHRVNERAFVEGSREEMVAKGQNLIVDSLKSRLEEKE